MNSLLPSSPAKSPIKGSAQSRGFTLIELMVALTGGLMFSIFVFMLAKDSTRFYQNELRISTATHSVVAGFQRLRTDIARAGYLSTPNINRDPSACVDLTGDPGYSGNPALRRLASLRIDDTAELRHQIDLMGSFASADTFPIRAVVPAGGGAQVYLQLQSGAMARLLGNRIFNPTPEVLDASLRNIFRPGRVLRIVDKAGAQQFAIIEDINTTTPLEPFIQVGNQPQFRMKGDGHPCGLRGAEAGSLVNVVQRIRYSIQDLSTTPGFEPLFEGAEAISSDEGPVRTELVREELNWNDDTWLAGTRPEIVAEYAVGLTFRLTAADSTQNFRLTEVAANDLAQFAGDPVGALRGPHLIRSVRALLAVRASAPDRTEDILPVVDGTDDVIAPGLYRWRIQTEPPLYARVRTLQADIALRNQLTARW